MAPYGAYGARQECHGTLFPVMRTGRRRQRIKCLPRKNKRGGRSKKEVGKQSRIRNPTKAHCLPLVEDEIFRRARSVSVQIVHHGEKKQGYDHLSGMFDSTANTPCLTQPTLQFSEKEFELLTKQNVGRCSTDSRCGGVSQEKV